MGTAWPFRYYDAVQQCILRHRQNIFDWTDWREWRYCYEGGRYFRDEYLEEFVGSAGKEGDDQFERRRKFTPIPTYAKRAVNRVKNSVAARLVDVLREGGSRAFQDAIAGVGRGVDMRGNTMNAYIKKRVLPEMLVMGHVGVVIDAPELRPQDEEMGLSQADVPQNFSPYLDRFIAEQMPIMVPAPSESPSDWSHILVEVSHDDFNLLTGKQDCVVTFRYYWLEDEDPARMGKVNIVKLDEAGSIISEIKKTELEAIPFVLFEIDASLMVDVCSYQIALLNMMSADSTYAIDSNFPFLRKQLSATDIGAHLEGGQGDRTTRVGIDRGMTYGKGLDPPQYISPPTEPMKTSIALRQEMKAEVDELVMGSLADLGEDGSVEAGLAAIGEALEQGETRLWDHWPVFEAIRPQNRRNPTISYPESWTLLSEEERIAKAEKFIKLGNLIIGENNKKELHKKAVLAIMSGQASASEINRRLAEVDASPMGTADPAVIIPAKEKGIISAETAALALGAQEGESEKAQADMAERAKAVVAAQSDAANGAARGNPDGSVDPNANTLAREGETEGADNLRETSNPGRPETEE